MADKTSDDPSPDIERALTAALENVRSDLHTAIAVRAALTTVPFAHTYSGSAQYRLEHLYLSVFRCLLAASVSAVRSTAIFKDAAKAAYNRAYTEAAGEGRAANQNGLLAYESLDKGPMYSESYTVFSAVRSAAYVAATQNSDPFRITALLDTLVAANIMSDLDLISLVTDISVDAKTLMSNPINHVMNRDSDRSDWQSLRSKLLSLDQSWRFWIDWYQSHLTGGPKNWDLLQSIALIPNEDWTHKDGPAHVNAIIAGMVAPQKILDLAEALPTGTLIRRTDTGAFEAVPSTITDADRYQNALQKVMDAIDDMEMARTVNQDRPIDIELRRLKRRLEQYWNTSKRTHDEIELGLVAVVEEVTCGALDSTRDVKRLTSALTSGIVDIRASDTEVDRMARSRIARKLIVSQRTDFSGIAALVKQDAEESVPDLRDFLQTQFEIMSAPLSEKEIESQTPTKAREIAHYDVISTTAQIEAYKIKEAEAADQPTAYRRVVNAADDARKVQGGVEAANSGLRALLDFVSQTYDKF